MTERSKWSIDDARKEQMTKTMNSHTHTIRNNIDVETRIILSLVMNIDI